MGYSFYENSEGRDCGYGVPAFCDHPDCNEEIDRGVSYKCGDGFEDYDLGCGLFFCREHLKPIAVGDVPPKDIYSDPVDKCDQDETVWLCDRCRAGIAEPYEPKPDTEEWITWKLTDDSWGEWRKENPSLVSLLKQKVNAA